MTLASRYITSASHYDLRYKSGSLMYIPGLIPWSFAELAEAVPKNYNPEHCKEYIKSTVGHSTARAQ